MIWEAVSLGCTLCWLIRGIIIAKPKPNSLSNVSLIFVIL